MNSDVTGIDQVMSTLLTLNKHRLQSFYSCFCFTLAEHNVIKFSLHINCSAQAVNNISESAISNSNKQIKFAQIQKLFKLSTLNSVHKVELKQEIPCLFDVGRNVLTGKKHKMDKK